MNTIVPINIAAIRVSPTDSSNIVTSFKGRVAYFDNMPFGKPSKDTSTGDTIVQLLESTETPLAPFNTGIHLHWELPDFFRKGVQDIDSNKIVFPQVPNRWLVVRYLSIYNTSTNTWGPITNYSWIIESDFISMQQLPDSDGVIRPSVPVPLPVDVKFGASNQPYRFMGRVVDATKWPDTASGNQYLKDYKDLNNENCYLTSVGFLGPGFSAYYPDCCSVFGFIDRFLDNTTVYNALQNNSAIQFKTSYQVTGWIADGKDPMDGLAGKITTQYNDYVKRCRQQNVEVTKTPANFFEALARQQFKWQFGESAISFKLDDKDNITELKVPEKTICSGIMQEIVWNMLVSPGSSSFLGSPETPTSPGVWQDKNVKIAVGNTSVEALSALLKSDSGNTDNDPDLLDNYEYLLNALQLGILRDLETDDNNVIALEEAIHSSGFASQQGGLEWAVQQRPTNPDQTVGPVSPQNEITLPLDLAEQLSLLNKAQKDYDMGRSALTVMRKQLYMDWYRYIKMYAGNEPSANVPLNTLMSFLTTGNNTQLSQVVTKGNDIGVVNYVTDPNNSRAVTGITKPTTGSTTSAAWKLWQQLDDFMKTMAKFPDWQVIGAPGSSFWMPTDPVAVMEGKRLEPVRRNGTEETIPVRVSAELLTQLTIGFNSQNFTVTASANKAQAPVNSSLPYQSDFVALAGETSLLVPSLADGLANALAEQGGDNNPAKKDLTAFVNTLKTLQGGVGKLQNQNPDTGLYSAIRQSTYKPVANPVQQATAPQAISVTFTNTNSNGWAPNAVQWNTQLQYPEFSANRYDPFLPVSMIWKLTLDPLQRKQDALNYNNTNVINTFKLNDDAIDFTYGVDKLPFTTGNPFTYDSSVVMSKKATFSIVSQINNFIGNYPDDAADDALQAIADGYKNRKILAQSMSGLNVEQLLNYYIPQIPVMNLTFSELKDSVTKNIRNAALSANVNDNWYNDSFNSQAPIPTSPTALANYGPLRGGFVSILALEVVDAFGQRLQLFTEKINGNDGSLTVIPAMTMKPAAGDTANAHKLFLAPRVLAPSRMWFKWLSAIHNSDVKGVDSDFVEMNSHPATSPVCGWVLPNHLNNSLFFYDVNATPIGSFGIEHGSLQYRTRAGNIDNPGDVLASDIGPQGTPLVNEHLANFMWYIFNKSQAEINNKKNKSKQSGFFLAEMMQAILNSEPFINPANHAQDASLAVLIGRPLAITRAVAAMETAGNVVPLNQTDINSTDPWPVSVNNGITNYMDRQNMGAANIANVQFSMRLGDLSNIDDGLIGYLIEANAADPYGTSDFFAPAAIESADHGVCRPGPNNILLTLNSTPTVLTFLMDPRASVHATTGVLPVEELAIPEDQYSRTLSRMQMTFFTMPVLERRQGLIVPLPTQSGYVWQWINPGNQPTIPLAANAANSNATWDYSPQTLLEGWLNLMPDPNPAPPPGGNEPIDIL